MGYIYWIASYPKSGNTWMRAFLTAMVTGKADDLDALREVAPDDNSGRYYKAFMKQSLDKAGLAEFARVRPAAQRAMAAAVPGFLFLKTHSMVARHLGTPTINTDVTAGAIYIVRNPLDVAVSYSEFRDRDFDLTISLMGARGRVLERPAFGAYQLSGSWSENVESWTRKPHDRLHVVRYEDMLAKPLETFTGVVRFLHLRADEATIATAVEQTSFETLKSVEADKGFAERPHETQTFFRSGRTGEGRERLSPQQIGRIARDHREQMHRLGYWEPEFEELAAQVTGKYAEA